ncbi:hypothetical protein DTO021D3_346 [Paecilomyces variotii]|nr:hypothetical protein DTO032I3_329 [Paecilomyces variotii]KAJ9283009.1 hypothetical protein DTO021D3_346 [Paecilomyces variotii]KAJ9346812.1 hypothetical protein DTO027B6_379 [Paecilomyces variotii]KAJ9393635.1 hypothetical protein DTO032I4_406 [Paecilomyces variotii]
MDPRFLLDREKTVDLRILKPIVRAYALSYLSSTVPRIVSWVRLVRKEDANSSPGQRITELRRILVNALRLNGFPAFCAFLVAGSTLLPVLILRICSALTAKAGTKRLSQTRRVLQLVRFLSAFISSWFSFRLLNKRQHEVRDSSVNSSPREEDVTVTSRHDLTERPELTGRTLDLTLFVFTRAVDVVACIAWERWRQRRKAQNRWTFAESIAPRLADSVIFTASTAAIMWAWFYEPERLPRSYEKWIGEAAKVDSRLIEALRRARRGIFVYGKDTGQAPLLQSMCEDYNWPLEWGDPAKTIPIPCEMVHMGCGPSCEKHAAWRFVRAFKFASATYLPLQLALRLRTKRQLSRVVAAVKDTLRSSTFLASFITIFYYSVCLARTRLGPKIFDYKTITPMMWDSGLCVGAGCLFCGCSVLVEGARRRQELALFVAPRAAATLLPRRYEKKYEYREQAAFALSTAVIFTCLQERPEFVRGFIGRIGARVIR